MNITYSSEGLSERSGYGGGRALVLLINIPYRFGGEQTYHPVRKIGVIGRNWINLLLCRHVHIGKDTTTSRTYKYICITNVALDDPLLV
jgi:hypothetical protein